MSVITPSTKPVILSKPRGVAKDHPTIIAAQRATRTAIKGSLQIVFACLAFSIITSSPTAAREARVVLRNSNELSGEITFTDDAIEIRDGDDSQTIHFDDIKRCIFDHDMQETKKLNFDDHKLSEKWQGIDIGKMVKEGRAVGTDSRFLLEAHNRPEDEEFASFHMVYISMVGNCEISARVVSMSDDDEDSRAAIIFRGGLDERNSNHMLSLSPKDGIDHRAWKYRGGISNRIEDAEVKAPYWLRLIRRGDRVESQYSSDGRRWNRVHEHRSGLPEGVTVGLAVMARGDGVNRVLFDNVHIGGLGSHPSQQMPPKLQLISGTVLVGEIASADQEHFEIENPWFQKDIPVKWISRVSFVPPQAGAKPVVQRPDRKGLQLRGGDFLDGNFYEIKDDQIIVDSVLFGRQSFRQPEKTDALLLAPPPKSTEGKAFSVTLDDGSIIVTDELNVQEETMHLQTEFLGELQIALDKVERVESQ